MGQSSSPIELAGKLTNFGTTGIPTAMRAGVAKAALAGKVELTAAGVAAGLPSSHKLRNWTKNGKWGVRYSLRGKANPTAILWMWGPAAYVFNEGSPDHDIVPNRKGRGRAKNKAIRSAKASGTMPTMASGTTGGRATLKLPGGDFRRAVHVKGMAGRHFWRPSAASVERTASRVVATQTSIEMAKHFR